MAGSSEYGYNCVARPKVDNLILGNHYFGIYSGSFVYDQHTVKFTTSSPQVVLQLVFVCQDNSGGSSELDVAIDDVVLTEYTPPCALIDQPPSDRCGVVGLVSEATIGTGNNFAIEFCAASCGERNDCASFEYSDVYGTRSCKLYSAAVKDLTVIFSPFGNNGRIYDVSCFIQTTPDPRPTPTPSPTPSPSPTPTPTPTPDPPPACGPGSTQLNTNPGFEEGYDAEHAWSYGEASLEMLTETPSDDSAPRPNSGSFYA